MIDIPKPTTKKCPMCAEDIPLAAVICEYCGAKFAVTSIGYCQHCHDVRETDENCQCRVCGNTVVDLQVESRFIDEKVQKTVSKITPTDRPEISLQKKKFPSIGIFVGVLVFTIVITLVWFGKNSVPAISNLLATDTPTVTTTFTPTKTPTASLTPRPTLMRTPNPTPTIAPDRRILNPANQHLYSYVKIQLSWHGARDYCAALGGYLVSIQVPSENKFVYELVKGGNHEFGTWLGGTDEENEGTWKWVTGEPWSYQSWLRTSRDFEPDDNYMDTPNGADYLKFHYSDKTWRDESSREHYFVCEWEP